MDKNHTDRLAELEKVEKRDENQEAEYQGLLKYKSESEKAGSEKGSTDSQAEAPTTDQTGETEAEVPTDGETTNGFASADAPDTSPVTDPEVETGTRSAAEARHEAAQGENPGVSNIDEQGNVVGTDANGQPANADQTRTSTTAETNGQA